MIDIAAAVPARVVQMIEIKWAGLRLTAKIDGAADLPVDLCDEGGTSLLKSKRTASADGRVSIPVSDEYEGRRALLIVFADDGITRMTERWTIVGGGA